MSQPKTLEEQAIDLERAKRHAKRVIDAEEQPEHPPIKPLSLGELFERPAPRYVIDQMIPQAGLGQIVGEPGTLKTFFILDAALSIASGQRSFFGYPITQQGVVLFIAAEGAGGLQYRVRAWCSEHRVNPLEIPFHVIPMPVNLRDPNAQQEIAAVVANLHPLLIVFDTLSRCTPGAEENSARDMGEVVGFCAEMQKGSGAAIVFVHHPPKSDPRGGGRGSGVVFGAVDTEIRISTDEGDEDIQNERVITITCAKQKDDQKFPPLDLVGHVVPVCDLHGREMAHESGRAITSIVLRIAEPEDVERAAEKAAAADREIELRVLRIMSEHPAATNQKKLRDYAGLKQDVVNDAVGRILRAGLAVEGKRGQPFVLTDAGVKALGIPF